MRIYLVIPAHNEQEYIAQMLNSLVHQTVLPHKIIVVDDASSDRTFEIASGFAASYPFIQVIKKESEPTHEPGAKVIQAFYEGLKQLDEEYDLLGKFDADIILPPEYFEKMQLLFLSDPKIGMASGNLFIQKDSDWIYEDIAAKDKVRGPIKLYRKSCFKEIGELKKAIGWDTIDELLARYKGWKVETNHNLHVKHLKPTGKAYTKSSRFKQGEAFYNMRYGFFITVIAAAKLAWKKKSGFFLKDTILGYLRAARKSVPAVTAEEGKFIRKYRLQRMLSRFGF